MPCACAQLGLTLQPRGLQPARLPCHGILQARILDWVAMPISRGSSQFSNLKKLKKKKKIKRDFSGGLVTKTPHSQCKGANFHPANYKLALPKAFVSN